MRLRENAKRFNLSSSIARPPAISAWLKKCAGDFKLVQTWAGHGTLSQTLDRYGHLIPRDGDHVIADAERALG